MEITKKYPICEKHGKYAMSPESQAVLTCNKCEEEHEQDMQEADDAHFQMEKERRELKAGFNHDTTYREALQEWNKSL